MPRRATLSDRQVIALKPQAKRYAVPDPELNGHYIRVEPSGAKAYAAVARDPYGKQIWATIGHTDLLNLDEAREEARAIIKRIKGGQTAKEKPPVQPDSYRAVSDNWLVRHAEKNRLITKTEIVRILNGYILPTFGERDFTSIKRSDISALLDKIEDKHGARMADLVLATMRAIANWYASRDDGYVSPFVRGMRRSKAKPRNRILSDDEIRRMWSQAGDAGTFGAFLKMLLLTAQRRAAVQHMRWSDLADDVWTMPKEERGKGNGGALKLPTLAVEIITAQAKVEGNPFVFAGRNGGPFTGFTTGFYASKVERGGSPPWTLHDLRRTARSLLARCGISREIAEQILGHALPGVEGTYNRFAYTEEKGHALAALAAEIERIATPPRGPKVVPIRRARAG
jgi:integrase